MEYFTVKKSLFFLFLAFPALKATGMPEKLAITDLNNDQFVLTERQSEAFKACEIYKDLLDAEVQTDCLSFSDCKNKTLTKENIRTLMNCIVGTQKITGINSERLADLFELALYMSIPEETTAKIAQVFYEKMECKEPDPRLKHFLKIAKKYLPYYPTVGDFFEDFIDRYIQNDNTDARWRVLFPRQGWHLDLSHQNLSRFHQENTVDE